MSDSTGVNSTASSAVAALDLVDTDIESAVFKLCLEMVQDIDSQILAKLNLLREMNERKKELVEKLKKLRQLLIKSGAKNPEDKVKIGGSLDEPETPLAQKCGDETKELNVREYNKQQVDEKIHMLEAEIADMNSSTQLVMLDLQKLMNQRSQMLQLSSNVDAKCHQAAMGIIANIK